MELSRGRVVVTLCAVFAFGLAVQPGALAQSGYSLDPDAEPSGPPANPPGIRIVEGNGAECTFIDFEGVGDLQPVGTVSGTPAVTFGDSWLGIIDSDAGGSGNFANEPSPDTTAFFLDPAEPITFDTGVQYLEVFYSASAISLPVTLSAWDGPDGTGNLIDTAMGDTVGSSGDGADCVGDPNGTFCLWDSMTLTAPADTILSVTLEGAVANQFGFDDMLYCTAVPVPTLPSYRWAIVLALMLLVGAALTLRGRLA